jgi:hypothetical protein
MYKYPTKCTLILYDVFYSRNSHQHATIVGVEKEQVLDCVWNVMAHAQKPDFVFRRNGRVHLNWQGRQFSPLLAAEVCASAVVMLYTMFRGSVKSTGYPLHSPVSPSLPLPCVTVCHHISTGLYVFCVYVCNPSYPACPAHASCYIVFCDLSGTAIFYAIVSDSAILNTKCVSWFSLQLLKHFSF